MRWTPGGRSDDIEDDRDQSGGGGGGFNLGGIHIGIGGFLILLVLSLVFKRNFLALAGLGGVSSPTQVSQPETSRDQREEPLVQFVSFVLDDTQKTWMQILSRQGVPYGMRSWCCSGTESIPRAAWRNPQAVRFTAREMRRYTLISGSMTN